MELPPEQEYRHQFYKMFDIPAHLVEFGEMATQFHDDGHKFDHGCIVYQNAIDIALAAGLELTYRQQVLLMYIAIGHDFADHKVSNKATTVSAARLLEYYTAHVGHADAMSIMHVHNNCSWSQREKSTPCADMMIRPLQQLLQDADWMESLGYIGIRRAQIFIEADGETDHDIISAGVCEYINRKLLRVPESFNFAVSREMSKPRIMILLQYLAKHGVVPDFSSHRK